MKLKLVALIVVAAFALANRACSHFDSYWYEGFLPQALEVEEALFVEGGSGFREGCGVAIYRLNGPALARIRTGGLAALREARTAKRHQDRQYGDWTETPYVEPKNEVVRNPWMSGMNEYCSDIPAEMQRAIDAALSKPGSFYVTAHESGLIVMPELGWVILSHYG